MDEVILLKMGEMDDSKVTFGENSIVNVHVTSYGLPIYNSSLQLTIII